MVVLEIFGGGKHPKFERIPDLPISIGRALDNDLIIDDPYVDPHHLRLELNSDHSGWIVSDLSSTNHTVKNRQNIEITDVKSGDELLLGKTRIRVYSENHAVAPTLSLRDLEHWLLGFDAIRWVVLLMTALAGTVCLQMYLESTEDAIKPDVYATTVITILASVILVGGIWALISRIMKGEPRFTPLLNLTLVQSMVVLLLTLLLNVIFFNIPGTPGREILENIISLVLFVVYVYLGMVLTTRLGILPRILFCGVILFGTLGFMAIAKYSKEDRFVRFPNYDAALYSPHFLVRSGASEEEFRSRLPALFERASKVVNVDK